VSTPYWRRIETASPINDFALNRLARRCLCNTLGRTLRDWPRIAARFPPPVLAPRLSSTSLARASLQPCARSLAQQRAVPLSSSSRSRPPVVGWPRGPIDDDPILPLIAAISWHADLSSNWFRARRWLPPNCVPISLEYSQHRAKRHDVVAMAIERRGVQSRGAASVKKQGIGAIQPVTE
jgi:hypothetical protein